MHTDELHTELKKSLTELALLLSHFNQSPKDFMAPLGRSAKKIRRKQKKSEKKEKQSKNLQEEMSKASTASDTSLLTLTQVLHREAARVREGGGAQRVAQQHKKGKLSARERIALLIDSETKFLEIGLFAAHNMYQEQGGCPAAGVIVGSRRSLWTSLCNSCQ